MSLTDADRDAIAEARRLGPELRASTSDRDRLAGWLLAELVTLAERLAAQTTDGAAAAAHVTEQPQQRTSELFAKSDDENWLGI